MQTLPANSPNPFQVDNPPTVIHSPSQSSGFTPRLRPNHSDSPSLDNARFSSPIIASPPSNHYRDVDLNSSTVRTPLMSDQDASEIKSNGHVPYGEEKADYRIDLGSVQNSTPKESKVFGLATSTAGSGQMIEQALTHPALPVLSYCVASILMTVVNKVSLFNLHLSNILLTLSTVCGLWSILQYELFTFKHSVSSLRSLRNDPKANQGRLTILDTLCNLPS